MRSWTALLFLPLLVAGCSHAPQSNLPTTQMQIGSMQFTLEVANNGDARHFGLMQRDAMPSDRGMIFVFPEEQDLQFWMRDTRIPLDILYLDHAGRIVSIKTMKPYDETTVPSDGPAQYAIELNAGQAAKTGVKPGDVLKIPDNAREAK